MAMGGATIQVDAPPSQNLLGDRSDFAGERALISGRREALDGMRHAK
jgi:hypothetical protein